MSNYTIFLKKVKFLIFYYLFFLFFVKTKGFSLKEYTIEEMIQLLLVPYQTLDMYDIKEYLPTLLSKITTIKDELSNIDMHFLFGILIHKITYKEEQDLLPLLPFIGEQIACAFFISTLYLYQKEKAD